MKIILLQKEYLETIEGQNMLVDKVNEDTEEDLYFAEGSYGSTDIMTEALYRGFIENELLQAMFFGDKTFEYRYSPWECELHQQNPSEEEIVKHIKECYGEDDEENIACIKRSAAFHDMVDLKWITVDKAKEIISNLSIEVVLQNLGQLEEKLKKERVCVEEWRNVENRKFLERLLFCIEKSATLGTGVLYAHTLI